MSLSHTERLYNLPAFALFYLMALHHEPLLKSSHGNFGVFLIISLCLGDEASTFSDYDVVHMLTFSIYGLHT